MRIEFCFISSVLLLSLSAPAFSSTPTSDPCRAKALSAAQAEYGLDPFRCTISTVSAGEKYKVYVGIGNAESGEHLYYVTFANGCGSEAVAEEAPEVAISPLQDDTHAVYGKLISYNTDISPNLEISPSELPAKAQKAYAASEQNLKGLISSWSATDKTAVNLKLSVFKVEVDGQDTFSIFTPNLQDSIREGFYVLDSKGNEIDSGSVYHSSDVGVNGLTWQDESVQK
jgi:hypothetical protein